MEKEKKNIQNEVVYHGNDGGGPDRGPPRRFVVEDWEGQPGQKKFCQSMIDKPGLAERDVAGPKRVGKRALCDMDDVGTGRNRLSAGIAGNNMSCQNSSRGYLEAGVRTIFISMFNERTVSLSSIALGR